MREMGNAYDILVGISEGKRPIGTRRLTDWSVTIKRILKKYGVDWIKLVQDRVQCQSFVNKITNIRIPGKAKNFLIS
jgi:hypothetical protein